MLEYKIWVTLFTLWIVLFLTWQVSEKTKWANKCWFLTKFMFFGGVIRFLIALWIT